MISIKKNAISIMKKYAYLLFLIGNLLTSFCLVYYGLKEYFDVWKIMFFE